MNPLRDQKGSSLSASGYNGNEGVPSSVPARGPLAPSDSDKGSGSTAQVMQHEGAVKDGKGTGPAAAKLGKATDGGKSVGNAPATRLAATSVQNADAENPLRNRAKPWK